MEVFLANFYAYRVCRGFLEFDVIEHNVSSHVAHHQLAAYSYIRCAFCAPRPGTSFKFLSCTEICFQGAKMLSCKIRLSRLFLSKLGCTWTTALFSAAGH